MLTVHALISGTLGALILAVAILYRRQKRQEALIRQLSAEVTAQKIAALTGQQQRPAEASGQPPEPARRRKHLALYIGGGFAAAFTACRKALGRLDPKRTVATVAVTSVAAVSATAGVYMSATGGEADTQPPAATAPAPEAAQSPRASDDEHIDTKNVANEEDASEAETEVESADLNPATAEAPAQRMPAENIDPAEIGTEPDSADDEAPERESPAPTPPPASDNPDPTPPDQPNAPEETEPPAEDEDDGSDGSDGSDPGEICIGIPKFIELCFSRGGMTGTVLDRPIHLRE